MLIRLLTILFSSWITTPLVLIFAHAHGFANIDTIQLILITQAAQTPLLVLFNECATPSYIKQNSATPKTLIAGTTIAQFFIIYLSLTYSGRDPISPLTFIATILATASSVITLFEAQRVTYAALTGGLSFRASLSLGVIPSTALLALYFAHYYSFGTGHQEWLILHLILPALVYRHISAKLPAPPNADTQPSRDLAIKSIFAGVMLLVLTATNVQTRSDLGETIPEYSSFILAALNISASLFLTISRVNHIKSGANSTENFTYTSVLPALGASALIAMAPSSSATSVTILKFLILQAALIYALIKFRAIWQQSHTV